LIIVAGNGATEVQTLDGNGAIYAPLAASMVVCPALIRTVLTKPSYHRWTLPYYGGNARKSES